MEEIQPYRWLLLSLTLLFAYLVYMRRGKWDFLRTIFVLLAMVAGIGFLFSLPEPNVFKQSSGQPGHLSH